VNDTGALDALRMSQSRVQSIALLHQRLYQGEELKSISIKTYLFELAQSLQDTYQLEERQISIVTDVDEISMDLDLAIPTGLIVNELVINAIKHAFPNNQMGEINIGVKKQETGFTIKVRDNGVGIKLLEGKPVDKTNAFGLELVESLAEKIKASLVFSNGQGTSVEAFVHFNKHEPLFP